MRSPAVLLVATVLMCAVAAGGCGVGPGESEEGQANLRVTSEFGAEELVDATLDGPTESDSVVRFLDDEADIETSYGGNFVDSIDGLAGSTINGGQEDWFFFVNGYYSDIGAGEARVRAGDRIWWDFRRWQEAYRVSAVVGSWPEPFLHGHDGEERDVVIECVGGGVVVDACDTTTTAFDDAGIDYQREDVARPEVHPDELRVLVGAWSDLREDPAAAQIEDGPSTSGVYATVQPCGDAYDFELFGSDAKPRLKLTSAGLVAAVRNGEDQPTWVVAGSTPDNVDEAAALINEDDLRDHYAVAAGPSGGVVPVPAPDDLPVDEDDPQCG